jgi:hypothetical protein
MSRSDRGVVFPSPVVMLSIIAVVMAGIAYVATRSDEPTERKVTAVAEDPGEDETPDPTPSTKETKKPRKPPPVKRAETYVVVFNNTNITGLAGRVADEAAEAGWNVVGSDNWVGTIPANTVYYPKRLKAAAEQLALDLGISRTAPAVDPMALDRLTVILTGEI